MILKKINFILFFLIFILFFTWCWKDKNNVSVDTSSGTVNNNQLSINTGTGKSLIEYFNLFWGDLNNLVADFWNITSTWNIEDLKKSLNNEDFQNIQIVVDRIVNEQISNTDLTKQDKIKIQSLKYIKVMAILNEWNYFYTEKEKSELAKGILNSIIVEYPYSINDYLNNYYLWYSKEILNDYTWALDNYNNWLNSILSTDIDWTYKSVLKNQIWHIYEKKWEKSKAYQYYNEAYSLNNKNYRASLNIARYLTRLWKFEEAKNFYLYSLRTHSKFLQSEIYYSLSTLELLQYWLSPDIEKSINAAKKSIELNVNNAMWYMALARWLYMLNDSKYDNEIIENLDKSIKLNPNWSEAYRYYALYYLDKKNLIKSISYIEKSKEVIDKDVIIIDDQKKYFKYFSDLYKSYIWSSFNKLDDVYGFYNKIEYNNIIKIQLNRKNNWIYLSISHTDDFKNIVEYYKSDLIPSLWEVAIYYDSKLTKYFTWNILVNTISNMITDTVTFNNSAVWLEIGLTQRGKMKSSNVLKSKLYSDVLIAPVLPIVTKSTSNHNWCSTYISSWLTDWSHCKIEGNWNIDWTIKCVQTPSFEPDKTVCWNQVCNTTYIDWTPSIMNCSQCIWCPEDVSQETILQPETKTISISLNNSTTTCNWIYANNSENCSVIFSVSWQTNQNKDVVWWWNNWNISNIVDLTSYNDADVKQLNFSNVSNTWPITGTGFYKINWIKSKTPFLTSTWMISIKVWDTNFILNNLNYYFKKSISWIISNSKIFSKSLSGSEDK